MSQDNGSQIVVYDEYGRSMTLDVAAQEIRTIDDGQNVIIRLTPEQAAEALTAFQGTVYYDQVADQVTAWAAATCGEGGCVEETSRIRDPLGIISARKGATTHKRYAPQPGRRILSVNQPTKANETPARMLPTLAPHAPVFNEMVFEGADPCQTMRGQIVSAVTAYRQRRPTVLETLRNIAHSMVPRIDENGSIVVHIPTGEGTGAALENNYAEQAYEWNRLNLMTVIYTSHGCGTVNWGQMTNGGGSWAGGGGSGSSRGGSVLVCHDETWRITSNGSSRFVTAEVCEYEPM